MKKAHIHNNLIEIVATCLEDIFEHGYYADKVIEYRFRKNKQFGARDRKFIAETTYNIVRNFIYLKEVSGIGDWGTIPYLKIVDNYLKIFGVKKETLSEDIIKNKKTADKDLRIRYSYPIWLYEYCESSIGKEKWQETIKYLHEQAELVIRCNSSKISPEKLIKEFKKENVKAEIIEENAILITERVNLFRTESFKKGYFEVQDYSSQQVAIMLDPKPGEYIIDACAGAGGKALHIADLMQNKGKILSLDIEDHKLEQLQKRSKRDGFSNIETRFIKNNKTIKRLKDRADKLLLDVPCTGLGVLKRNPDTKYKLTKERISELTEIQGNILEKYPKMLKQGGVLVYATCSILPEENSDQVKKFLDKNKNYELIEERNIFPQDKGFDGFYVAKMVKKM